MVEMEKVKNSLMCTCSLYRQIWLCNKLYDICLTCSWWLCWSIVYLVISIQCQLLWSTVFDGNMNGALLFDEMWWRLFETKIIWMDGMMVDEYYLLLLLLSPIVFFQHRKNNSFMYLQKQRDTGFQQTIQSLYTFVRIKFRGSSSRSVSMIPASCRTHSTIDVFTFLPPSSRKVVICFTIFPLL